MRSNISILNDMKKSQLLVMTGIAGMFTACSDFDFEEHHMKEDPVKKAEYSANWSATFGKIDPKQDWNTVAQVTAYVDFSEYDNLEGCTLKVYNGNPASDKSELLAKYDITNPKMVISFDALKASKFVYIVREKADGFYAAQIADINDGMCYASFDEFANSETRGAAPLTRAADTWNGSVPAGQYSVSVPSNAYEVSGEVNQIDSNTPGSVRSLYIHDANIHNTNFWMGGLDFFFEGRVSIDKWLCQGNSNLYVMNGATLTLTQEELPLQDNSWPQATTTITVCPGGKLVIPNATKVEFAARIKVYSKGTIQIGSDLSISNDALVVNEGELSVGGEMRTTNGTSCLVNTGNLTAAYYGAEGSSTFYNQPTGVMTVTGESRIDSNCSAWQNYGHYTTGTMVFNATSGKWHNACYLKVIGDMHVYTQDGSPALTNDAYIECGSYYQDVSRMELSADAQLTVNGTATFQYNCYRDKQDGLISTATGGSWAVFKANKIVFTKTTQHGSISYVGNLIVDCNDYPERTSDSGLETGYNWSLFNGAKLATSGDGYTIPADGCREPYNPTKPDPTPEIPGSYIIACEDLGTTNDIDFNDIVIRVSHVSGQTTATVTPLAAGGTLKSNLLFKNRNLGEIHYLINGSTGESGEMEMLNTNYGGNNPGPGAPIEIEVATDFTLSYDNVNMGGFSIVTYQKNSDSPINSVIIRAPEQGSAPQMILVPGNWQWPTERVQIYSAYPQFESWSQYGGLFTDWYNNPMTNASIMSL